jgi:CHAT domain-containing protein/tetratricopeptide (TPR) repeat protein
VARSELDVSGGRGAVRSVRSLALGLLLTAGLCLPTTATRAAPAEDPSSTSESPAEESAEDAISKMLKEVSAHLDAGRIDEARLLVDVARRRASANLGERHPIQIATLYWASLVAHDAKNPETALKWINHAHRLVTTPKKRAGRDTEEIMRWRFTCLFRLGHFQRAIKQQAELLETMESRVGPDSPDLIGEFNTMDLALHIGQRTREGEPHLRRALHIAEKHKRPDDRIIGELTSTLAYRLHDLAGDEDEARRLAIRALATDAVRGPNADRVLGDAHQVLGGQLLARGADEEAAPHLEKAVKHLEAAFGEKAPRLTVPLQELANLDIRSGGTERAVSLHSRAVTMLQATLEPTHPRVREALNLLAFALLKLKKHTEHLATREEIIALHRQDPKTPPVDLAFDLLLRSQTLSALGRFDAAKESIAEAIRTKDPDTATTEFRMSLGYGHYTLHGGLLSAGRRAEAELELRSAVKWYGKAAVSVKEKETLVSALNFLSSLVWSRDPRSSEARSLDARAAKIAHETPTMNWIVRYGAFHSRLSLMSDCPAATVSANHALRIATLHELPPGPRTAEALFASAALAAECGAMSDAHSQVRRALALAADQASVLQDIGFFRVKNAFIHLSAVDELTALRELLPPLVNAAELHHRGTEIHAQILELVGDRQYHLADYNAARATYEEALELRSRLHGEADQRTLECALELAEILTFVRGGSYYQAGGEITRRVVAQVEQNDALDPLFRAKTLMLGAESIWEPIESRRLTVLAIDILEAATRADPYAGVLIWNALARAYKLRGDRQIVERVEPDGILEHVAQVAKRVRNRIKKTPYSYERNMRAIHYYEKALAIHQRVNDEGTFAWGIHEAIATKAERIGLYDKALEHRKASMELFTQPGMRLSVGFHRALLELAGAYARAGRLREAREHFAAALVNLRKLVEQVAPGMPVQIRAKFIDRLDQIFSGPIDFISFRAFRLPDDADATAMAVEAMLLTDSLENQLQALDMRHIRTASAANQGRYAQLQDHRKELSTLLTLAASKTTAKKRRRAEELETEIPKLLDRLRESDEGRRLVLPSISIAAIRAKLPPKTALILMKRVNGYDGYVTLRPGSPFLTWGVEACVIRPDRRPRCKLLTGPEGVYLHTLAQELTQGRQPGSTAFVAPARALHEILIEPLLPLLEGVEHLAFTNANRLVKGVPLEVLIDSDGRYLVERFAVSYVSGGRDVLAWGDTTPSREPALVIGDPIFDTTLAASETRGQRARTPGLADLRFGRLPGTRREVNDIARILKIDPSRVRTGAKATEAALWNARGPRILHIATHGYNVQTVGSVAERAPSRSGSRSPTGKVAEENPGSGGRFDAWMRDQGKRFVQWVREDDTTSKPSPQPKPAARPATKARAQSPLTLQAQITRAGRTGMVGAGESSWVRTGLALTGFNQRSSAKSADDGMLTALEITGLDLSGTEVATLSACETGQSHLRQALVLAGAKTQMLALWRISDAFTAAWMGAWYEKIETGVGRVQALRDLQLAAIRGETLPGGIQTRGLSVSNPKEPVDPRFAGTRHPYYWASFVVSGEPGPLPESARRGAATP